MPRKKKGPFPKRKAVPNRSKAASADKPQVSNKNTSAGKSRAEGVRLFNLAGRPTKAQFQLVCGERGHLLTWAMRAKAGVPAEKFQAALAAAMRQAK
jgi:hypothetical protein